MAKLPTVVSNLAPDLRAFLNRVREAIDGKDGNRLVSVNDLLNGGIADTGPGGTLVPPVIKGTVGTPPAPKNVTATGGVYNVFVEWSDPKYYGHSHAEIWGAATDNIGAAVSLGMAPGVNFVDTLDPDTIRYYWVRFVNILGVAGPYNGVSGVLGQTTIEVDHVLEVLTGAITETELYQDLGARINLIDGPISLAGSVAARILEEAEARGAAITTERTLRQTADTSLASQITTVTAAVGANAAAIQTEVIARADADSAEASARQTLAARVTGSEGAILEESRVRASADGVLSERITSLVAKVDDPSTGLPATRAAVVNIENAKIGYCTIGGTATDQVDRPSCEAAGGIWHVGLPIATAVKQVSVSDGDNNLSLEQRFTAQKTTNGTLSGQYTVKIDNNGYVSGFGLASTPVNGTPYSSFTIRADKFSIAAPSGPGITPLVPFSVVTTPTVIDGENVPAGVYIDGAYIKGGTIKGSAILNGSITGTKLIDVSANKITGAALLSTSFIESAGYIQGASGWKIYGNGTAEFAAASIRGTLTASQINANGLSIKDLSGNVILNAGTGNFTGSIDGTAASTLVNVAYTANGNANTAINVAYTANGNANTAINGLGNKLNSDARNVLSGFGGLAAGTLNWNSQGQRTSGYGIGFTQGGFAAFNQAGQATFALSSATGDASFAGTITAGTVGGSNVGPTYVQSANFSSGSSGWQIASSGNAEFNQLTVRSGQVTGALLKSVSFYEFSGLYVYVDSSNPGTFNQGPYYWYGQGAPLYLVGNVSMPAPETAAHRIAVVANVQAGGGSRSKDLQLFVVANGSLSGSSIYGEEIANATSTGTFGMVTTAAGASNQTYTTSVPVLFFVGGFNMDYTVQTIRGLLFGVR